MKKMVIEHDNEPIVQRTKVPIKNSYTEYYDELRFDFWYSCAYCSITEIEACGIGFDIDHYLPQKHRPDLKKDYSNLMWSCKKCNSYKRDYYPDQNAIKKGNVVIKIDEENPDHHFELNYNILTNKTLKGEFNIVLLYLNRKALIKLRDIRRRLHEADDYIAYGVHSICNVRIDKINKKNRYLFLKIRDEVTKRKKYFDESNFSELIRDFAKSDLIDKEPKTEHNRSLNVRREYLKKQKAISL